MQEKTLQEKSVKPAKEKAAKTAKTSTGKTAAKAAVAVAEKPAEKVAQKVAAEKPAESSGDVKLGMITHLNATETKMDDILRMIQEDSGVKVTHYIPRANSCATTICALCKNPISKRNKSNVRPTAPNPWMRARLTN